MQAEFPDGRNPSLDTSPDVEQYEKLVDGYGAFFDQLDEHLARA